MATTSSRIIQTSWKPKKSYALQPNTGLGQRSTGAISKYVRPVRLPRQSTDMVLHVKPTGFRFNEEAAQDNKFMNPLKFKSHSELLKKVLKESKTFSSTLRKKDIIVVEVEGDENAPDGVFPNNWFSTHSDHETLGGAIVLYPMTTTTRRCERRPCVIQRIKESIGFPCMQMDFTVFEQAEAYFEGTGAAVLDRINKICYVGLSDRASKEIATMFSAKLGYTLISFKATDMNGVVIYHTNVMMAIATDFVVLCEDAIRDPEELCRVNASFEKTGKHVIRISLQQMNKFCGNILELSRQAKPKEINTKHQGRYTMIAMSKTAFDAFERAQKQKMLEYADELVPINVETIEMVGGGSVRCMIGEIFH